MILCSLSVHLFQVYLFKPPPRMIIIVPYREQKVLLIACAISQELVFGALSPPSCRHNHALPISGKYHRPLCGHAVTLRKI
jgi:hypothetical protein